MNSLFDALYLRMLLRDFFGKVVPGAAVLLACSTWVAPLPTSLSVLRDLPFTTWAFFVGGSWITAFAIQRLAEFELPLLGRSIFYYPPFTSGETDNWPTSEKRQNWFYEFQVKLTEHTRSPSDSDDRQQVERLVVIKEACGNSYVATVVTAGLLAAHATFSFFGNKSFSVALDHTKQLLVANIPTAALLLIAVLLLRDMHLIHAFRQYSYSREILRGKFSAAGSNGDDMTWLGQYPDQEPRYPSRWIGAIQLFLSIVAGLLFGLAAGCLFRVV